MSKQSNERCCVCGVVTELSVLWPLNQQGANVYGCNDCIRKGIATLRRQDSGTLQERVREEITAVCHATNDLLLIKNSAYGNSALDPVRVFSRSSALEQLQVRIDDKLSRLARGARVEDVPEDTVQDLIGYLVLLVVAKRLGVK